MIMEDLEHPAYYTGGIETWDFIIDKNLDFLLGNVIKYVVRAGKKPGNDELQDLKKAQLYLQKKIDSINAHQA